jgi:hypothetical protein
VTKKLKKGRRRFGNNKSGREEKDGQQMFINDT